MNMEVSRSGRTWYFRSTSITALPAPANSTIELPTHSALTMKAESTGDPIGYDHLPKIVKEYCDYLSPNNLVLTNTLRRGYALQK